MELVKEPISEPIPISLVSGRYLLFDINVVTYLRKTYNICGVFIGGIPQIPQQNVFLGLPVELLPEEVTLLMQKRVACIVDAAAWHKEKFSSISGNDRKKYLESLRSRGRMAQKTAEENTQRKIELSQVKHALVTFNKPAPSNPTMPNKDTSFDIAALTVEEAESILFDNNALSPPLKSSKLATPKLLPYTITPTSTYSSLSVGNDHLLQTDPTVPASYPLFAHLHSHSYYLTPGLRFGCDYTVYPGDPLRFHSHFLAVGYDWDEEIPLMDLIGGGRLGTGVKKGFLIGGRNISSALTGNEPEVRTFCIEWGGLLDGSTQTLGNDRSVQEMMTAALVVAAAMEASPLLGNATSGFTIGSWPNMTQYVPSIKDLLLAGPRMGMKMGSLFLTFSEAIDDILGGRINQRTIPEPTAMNDLGAVTTASTAMARQAVAQAGLDILEDADGAGSGIASRLSMESARSFGNVFQYSTSRWALACVVMAIILNRTHVYASTRRNLLLGWKVRFILRIIPIVLFMMQARSLLQSIQCQTSPDFAMLRWGNSSKSSELLFIQNGGMLHTISTSLLLGASDADSCRAVSMIPAYNREMASKPIELTGSLSRLWPLFETLCFSQFVETLSCAVQGRQVAAETGMTLFEHSLAFAEAEAAVSSSLGWGPFGGTRSVAGQPDDTYSNSETKAAGIAIKRSMILQRVNTAPEVLLIGFLSSMSHVTSHVLAIFNMQGRLRLVNTAFWGLCFMSIITWSVLNFSIDDLTNQALLRFPTVCIIGFIPHVLLFAGIIVCSFIYGLALALTAFSPPFGHQVATEPRSFLRNLLMAQQNMQANIPLASIRVSMHMDFYTALLKTGFSILTMASEAVYLNESQEINIKQFTWLEEDRMQEIEEAGAHWLRPTFRAPTSEHFGRHGMADSVGLVATKDRPLISLRTSTSGYAQERVASKAGKPRHTDRVIRDGVGASERSGRWVMAFELFAGITKLIISWSATITLKILAQLGIRSRPRWLLWLIRRPKSGKKNEKQQEDDPQTLAFWMLGDDGELTLPKDENVDVEVEMRKRLQCHGSSDEHTLEANLYNWWLNGGWFGGEDSSGDFKPVMEPDDEDTTSIISISSDATESVWESDGSEEDGQRTPTQLSSRVSREASPIADMPLSAAELAQLLHPQTPEQRAEAQALAAHFASDTILTRSMYRDIHRRERARVLTSARHRRVGVSSTVPSAEEEVEILEQLIISRRAFRDALSSSAAHPSSWADGASGMGDGAPQCVVCQSSPRSIIVWPCRCLSLCDDCRVSLAMKNFETCTCCRGRVTSFSRIFVP